MRYVIYSSWIHVIYLSIFRVVVSPTLGQLYGCLNHNRMIILTPFTWLRRIWVNSLASGWRDNNFGHSLWNCTRKCHRYSPFLQVMAWCCQAASDYLGQCLPGHISPYGVTRPYKVKSNVLIHKNDKTRPTYIFCLTMCLHKLHLSSLCNTLWHADNKSYNW